jgi:hypothetical protein
MKNKNVLFLFVLLFALVLQSCQKNASTEVNVVENKPIVPLSVGNTWSYSGISYDTLGSIVESYLESSGVSNDSIISAVRYFLYDNSWWSSNTDTGLVCLYRQGSQYLYKYPVVKGEKFLSIFGDTYVSCVDTIIQVPAGSYNCIRYEHLVNGNIRYQTKFISPGNGVVKFITYQSAFSEKEDQRVVSIAALNSVVIK